MRKFIFTTSLLLGSIFLSQAQAPAKNNLTFSYSIYEASRFSGGSISAQGFDIGYSRYFHRRIYGDISYGMKNFEGRNNQFFLDSDEMDYFNMRVFTLGVGYDIVQKERFILSGELSYLRQWTHELISVLESSSVTIRQTGMVMDPTARVQLKARIFLTENLQLVPAIAHGFQFSKYRSIWFRAGLAYSF